MGGFFSRSGDDSRRLIVDGKIDRVQRCTLTASGEVDFQKAGMGHSQCHGGHGARWITRTLHGHVEQGSDLWLEQAQPLRNQRSGV